MPTGAGLVDTNLIISRAHQEWTYRIRYSYTERSAHSYQAFSCPGLLLPVRLWLQRWSCLGGVRRGFVSGTKSRGQPACHKEQKKWRNEDVNVHVNMMYNMNVWMYIWMWCIIWMCALPCIQIRYSLYIGEKPLRGKRCWVKHELLSLGL